MSDLPKWWEGAPELTGKKKRIDYDNDDDDGDNNEGRKPKKATQQEIGEKLALAEKYYKEYVAKASGRREGAEGRWLKGFLSKGTVGDKIASLSVVAQKDPVCAGPEALKGLLGMARKKNRTESKMAMDALKLLFTQVMIPPFRGLRYFFEQPVTDPRAGRQHFVYWVFEDRVKKAFAEYVDVIEATARDTVSTQKEFALFLAYDLLKFSKALSLRTPRLVALLVNKLGDQAKQVCGKICTWLSDLVIKYPALKMPVTEEVERFLYRRNNSLRSQYYAVVFLSSLLLRPEKDRALATKLIGVYLSFFRRATGTLLPEDSAHEKAAAKARAKAKAAKGKVSGSNNNNGEEMDSRLLAAIMTGIHRAFPYADADSTTFGEHIDTLFRIARTATFNKSVQAFQLLYHFMAANDSLSDRFYTALYERIMAPEALVTNKQSLFFNIVYKSLRSDPSAPRVAAIAKRLLQLCAYAPAPFAAACLIMVSELMKEKPQLKAMAVHAVDDDDDEAEANEGHSSSSFKEAQVLDLDEARESKRPGAYKPMKRDPRFTNADKTCLWELHTLTLSYHPSIAKFAETILNGEPIHYAGDPLLNFTLVNFLDRFAFKNPKKRFSEQKQQQQQKEKEGGEGEGEGKGESESESDDDDDDDEVDEGKMAIPGKVEKLRSSSILPPINSEASIRRTHVPEEEKFFQQYFKLKAEADTKLSEEQAAAEAKKKKKKRKKDEDDEEENDDDMRDFFGEDDDDDDDDDGYAGFEEALEADAKDKTSELQEDGDAGLFNGNFDDFDDDDDDETAGLGDGFYGDEDDEDDEENEEGGSGKGANLSGFADVDDFSELLSENTVNPKQKEWEEGKRSGSGGGGSNKRKKPAGGNKRKNAGPSKKKAKKK